MLSVFILSDDDPIVLETNPILTNLNRVSSIYHAPDERLFIVEQGRNRFLISSPEGTRLDSLGRRGSGDYTFNTPTKIDATNGMRIYVADSGNNRVQIFDRRLQFLGSLRVPDRQSLRTAFFEPDAIAVNDFEDLFAFDRDSNNLVRFGGNGRFEEKNDLRLYDIRTPIRSISTLGESVFIGDERGVVHQLTTSGGYIGFVSVQNPVIDLYNKAGSVWVLTDSDLIQLENGTRVGKVFSHDLGSSVTSLAVSRSRFFISTSSTVYSAIRN